MKSKPMNVVDPVEIKPDGDANFYTLVAGNHWIARVQINGEFSVEHQNRMMERAKAAFGGHERAAFEGWRYVEPPTVTIDVSHLPESMIKDIQAHVDGAREAPNGTYSHTPGEGWLCFHCGERFFTPAGARLHFGAAPDEQPACQLTKAERGMLPLVRKLILENDRLRQEDSPSHRQFYSLGAEHHAALIAAEQKGYDRGLADGRTVPALTPVELDVLDTAVTHAVGGCRMDATEEEILLDIQRKLNAHTEPDTSDIPEVGREFFETATVKRLEPKGGE